MMADELFVAVCSLFTMILFRWSFHHLPQEKWQFLAAVPTCKGADNCWQGINLTYYGETFAQLRYNRQPNSCLCNSPI
jgi:hypothetical protein